MVRSLPAVLVATALCVSCGPSPRTSNDVVLDATVDSTVDAPREVASDPDGVTSDTRSDVDRSAEAAREPSALEQSDGVDAVVLESPAVWPAPDVVFDTPVDAAQDFVASRFGVDPILGDFEAADARSGEIEVRSNTDADDGTTVPRAVLSLQQLEPTDGWYVVAARSDGVTISSPERGTTVPAGPLSVSGEGRGFESTLNVLAFLAGDDTAELDLQIAGGGAFGELEPYESTVDLSGTAPGDVVGIVVRGDTGLSDDPGEFAATVVVIGASLPEAR